MCDHVRNLPVTAALCCWMIVDLAQWVAASAGFWRDACYENNSSVALRSLVKKSILDAVCFRPC